MSNVNLNQNANTVNSNDINLNSINLNDVSNDNIEDVLKTGVQSDGDFQKFFGKGSLDNMQHLLKDIDASGKSGSGQDQDDTQPGTVH